MSTLPSSRVSLSRDRRRAEPARTPDPNNRDVILKLLAFTLAMIAVPIGSYFVTVNTVFKGEQPFLF